MMHVDLNTEALEAVIPDGMEISLTIRLEGLSMQASLRKLQESADQLLGAFRAVSIAPSSFEIRRLDSRSREEKQCAALVLVCRCAADPKLLLQIWQVISQMSFTVEMQVRFYLSSVCSRRAALEESALNCAKKRAEKMAEMTGCTDAVISSLDFDMEESDQVSGFSFGSCQPVEVSEGVLPDCLDLLQPPTHSIRVVARTGWELLSDNHRQG